MSFPTTPNSKRTGSSHMTSHPDSDAFDPNCRGELDEGLRDELRACQGHITLGGVDSFPEYVRCRPKECEGKALIRLISHIDILTPDHGYERHIATSLNAYIDDVTPSSEFCFVYLDRPLHKAKIRPDIAVVRWDCLHEDLQKKRRELKDKAEPNISTQHDASHSQQPAPPIPDARWLPPIRPQDPVTQATVELRQMGISLHRQAKSLPGRPYLPRKAKNPPPPPPPPPTATQTDHTVDPVIFYSDIVALVEVTFGSKTIPGEMVQAAAYVREIRFSQPFRQFIPCLFMNHSPGRNSIKQWNFRIVHFDPAGYWHSGSHQPCLANTGNFSSVLRFLTSCNVGYSPDIVLNPPCHTRSEKRYPTTILVGKKREVKLIKILWMRKNLMGRCTFAYLAAVDGESPFVIKESWPDCNRTNEVEFLKLAAERQVPNMALLHPDYLDTDPTAFVVTTVNAIRHVNETTMPGNRHALRIPLDRQGFPIEEAASPWLIVAIMYCAISAIRGLSKDIPPYRALNHRDISLTNILLSDKDWQTKPLSEVAFLTDLDNAEYYDPGSWSTGSTIDQLKCNDGVEGDSEARHLHRTGTLLYMSEEALIQPSGFHHLPRHDMESVYYVGIILACLQDDGSIPNLLHKKWAKGALQDIGDMKLTSILGGSDMLQFLRPRHEVLRKFIRNAFEVVRACAHDDLGRYTKTTSDQLSHDTKLLRAALKDLEVLAESLRHEQEG